MSVHLFIPLFLSEIANVDDLMKMVPIQEFNKLLVSMQKIIEGVLHNRDMNWILTSGTSCKPFSYH